MLTKLEAIKALQKEYHYSEILKGDEFIKQEDGTTVRNKLYDIADAFGIKLPVITFQPDPDYPKGTLPNHTEECLTNKNWRTDFPCACWGISYTGIAVMDVVHRIANKYDVHPGMMGRGVNYRAQLEQLKKKVEQETIHITTGKMVSVPLNDK